MRITGEVPQGPAAVVPRFVKPTTSLIRAEIVGDQFIEVVRPEAAFVLEAVHGLDYGLALLCDGPVLLFGARRKTGDGMPPAGVTICDGPVLLFGGRRLAKE